MAKVLYTASATVVGGRGGRGQTSDGALDVELRMPRELGGEGGGTNPEQLFAIGYAACFDGAVGTVARRLRVEHGEAVIDAQVALVPDPPGRYKLSVRLDVRLASLDDELAAEIVRGAHEVCPYSNATRNNIEVVLTANGRLVPTA